MLTLAYIAMGFAAIIVTGTAAAWLHDVLAARLVQGGPERPLRGGVPARPRLMVPPVASGAPACRVRVRPPRGRSLVPAARTGAHANGLGSILPGTVRVRGG